MPNPPSKPSPAWVLVPLAVALLIVVVTMRRIGRVEHVTALASPETVVSAAAPTGYAGGVRRLVMNENISRSYEWIAQTQAMRSDGDFRLRHVSNENAPHGREVNLASPYRWWLMVVGWVIGIATDAPAGVALERASLYADPVLHLLLLAAVACAIARWFGTVAAMVASVAVGLLFPFAAGFLPAAPDDYTLTLVIAPWIVLPVMAAVTRGAAGVSKDFRRRAWIASGVATGAGLWLSVEDFVPIVAGLGLGALAAAFVARRTKETESGPGNRSHWRAWGVSAAAVVFLGYLIEYFPGHMGGWNLSTGHPLYAVAVFGAGELLARVTARIEGRPLSTLAKDSAACAAGLAAIATVPAAMWWKGNIGFFAVEVSSFRLTKQPGGVMAPNLAGWLDSQGTGAEFWATVLPVAIVVMALTLVSFKRVGPGIRQALLLGVAPVAMAIFLGNLHLRWWQTAGALLVPLLACATAAVGLAGFQSRVRMALMATMVALLLPGLPQLLKGATKAGVPDPPEADAIVERDLGHWLARRAMPGKKPVVHAPPGVTTRLGYFGGLGGLGTIALENRDGIAVAQRIAISTSWDEALALIQQRGVTHILIPSWDGYFDPVSQEASVQAGELFFVSLRKWRLPTWLRPLPYSVPGFDGMSGRSVKVFEVVEDQSEPLAASRLSEYFVEMGEPENVIVATQVLRRFPADFSALVARAQGESALGRTEEFRQSIEVILQRLQNNGDRVLPWDRRVSLVSVLARAGRPEECRAQARRCLAEVTEERLRFLTPYALLHFLTVTRAAGLQIDDPNLRSLALELLPPDLRASVPR